MAKFSFDPVAGLRLQREFLGDYFASPYVIAIAPDDGIWITNNGGRHLHIGNQLILLAMSVFVIIIRRTLGTMVA